LRPNCSYICKIISANIQWKVVWILSTLLPTLLARLVAVEILTANTIMSSSARLAATTRFLQRPMLYQAYPSLLWNARAGPSTSSGIPSNGLSSFVRTFSLSTSRFDSDKALPKRIKKKDADDEPPDQMEHQVPQPVFSLPGGLTFPFTRSPLADAALTTIIGLIMGEYFSG